jgi:hypothetical protein
VAFFIVVLWNQLHSAIAFTYYLDYAQCTGLDRKEGRVFLLCAYRDRAIYVAPYSSGKRLGLLIAHGDFYTCLRGGYWRRRGDRSL